MKIHQLPTGARFEYEGVEYEKTGPMFATGKGGQRLIPKYAVLKPLGEVVLEPETAGNHSMSRTAVLNAFEMFCASCKRLVPEDRQAALDQAREQFLRALQ